MAVIYSDQEIKTLIEEPKRAPTDWHDRIRLARKRGHSEQHVEFISDAGSVFRLITWPRNDTREPVERQTGTLSQPTDTVISGVP